MTEAVMRGLVSKKAVPKKNITISDKDPARAKLISKKYGVAMAESNPKAVGSADVVILAVKPQVMRIVLSELSDKIKPGQLVISIAAGITLASIEKYLPKVHVVRVMPNNPCLIGEGISAICGGSLVNESDIRTAEKIFSIVGDTVRVVERYMNAVTALSGSGPAFVYEALEAMIEGGLEAGLPKEMAKKLAEGTMLGSIKTVVKTKKSPEELVSMVASPGGTTVAGLRMLEEGNFKAAMRKAIVRASARAKEMSEEFERSL